MGVRIGGTRLFLAFLLPIFLRRNCFERGRPVRVEVGEICSSSGNSSKRPRKFCTKFVTRVAAVVAARASALRS